MKANDRLRRYTEKHKLTSAELARMIGCSQPYAWRLLHDGASPKVPLALRIERATDGVVRVADWGAGDGA
jgi:transcriptional regulator with XRE-family HTH domain